MKTGKFLDLTLTEASRNDQTDASQTVENICENDLILRDMGYFSTSVLRKIEKKRAWYLSKLPASTSIYLDDATEPDFKNLERLMVKSGITKFEMQVFLGENRLPVRLMIGLVPPAVYQERIRRKEAEEKRKGHKTKEKTKILLHFNLYITNTDESQLPIDKIMPLYRFRWQVELFFKIWKSRFSIHAMQKMKEARYITMLYIRLILIVVNLQIVNRLQYILSKQQRGILSYHKTMHTMKDKFDKVVSILRDSSENAVEALEHLFRILSKNHWREKRKGNENFIENIYLFTCISEI